MNFRTEENEKEYKKELKKHKDECYLCKEAKKVKPNKHYKIYNFYWSSAFCKKNDFPYYLADKHDLLISTDHQKEIGNLSFISLFFPKYDIVFQNKEKDCSIKEHPHYHLLTFKEDLTKKEKKEFVEEIKKNRILIYLKEN